MTHDVHGEVTTDMVKFLYINFLYFPKFLYKYLFS